MYGLYINNYDRVLHTYTVCSSVPGMRGSTNTGPKMNLNIFQASRKATGAPTFGNPQDPKP